MGEYTVRYELDSEQAQLLKENNTMLKELIKSYSPPLSDQLISAKKLRAELGISAKTEYNLRKRGALRGKKIGSRWYYDVSSITNLQSDSEIIKNAQ